MAMLKLREALQTKTLDPEVGFRIIPSPNKPSQLKMVLDRFKDGDKAVESEGVKILFLSPELIPMLEEMVIDYQETPQGGGFVISRLSGDK
jgi:Fe-S cluster assembly iron-binding protein IscA